MQHEYFGSRLGKGPSDGESAVVKRMASMAEGSHQASISNAQEMYQYCQQNVTKKDDDCSTHFKRSIEFVTTLEHSSGRQRILFPVTIKVNFNIIKI